MNHYLIVTLVNFAGKGLALLKILFLASAFGTSYQLDAFYIAYLLPVMLPDIFKGIVNTAFIPHFMKNREQRPEYFWRGMSALVSLTLLVQLLLAVILFLFAPAFVDLLAMDASDETRQLAVELTRVLSVIMPLLGLNALLVTLSHASEKFVVAAAESAITNVLIIAFILFLPEPEVHWLTLGVALGFCVFFAAMLLENRKTLKSHFRFRLHVYDESLASPVRQSIPLIVGYFGAMAMEIVDLRFVAKLEEGNISALNYAVMLSNLPFDIFIAAIIFTSYPALSRLIAEKQSIHEAYWLGISRILFFAFPSAMIFVFLGVPIIELLLQNGKFDGESVRATNQALFWLGIALIPKGLAYFHYRILHASLRSWTQVSIGLLGVVTNASLNFLWYEPFGLAGIAAATAFSLTQSFLLAFAVVYRHALKGILKQTYHRAIRPLMPLFIAVPLLLAVIVQLDSILEISHHKLDAAVDLGLAGLAAMLVIFVFRWENLPEIESAKSRVNGIARKVLTRQSEQ